MSVGSNYVELDNMPTMDQLLGGDSIRNEFAVNSIISGKVVEKRNDGALIDIGYKAEGFVPAAEFAKWDELKVGDQVDVYLEEVENDNSMPGISVQKAASIKAWNRITEECGEGSVVKGLMRHRVKGGIIVDIDGVEAFLPGSQIDIGSVRDMDAYIGKEYDVKILKINSERRNIVVSRRDLLEDCNGLDTHAGLWADADFCFSAWSRRGLRSLVLPLDKVLAGEVALQQGPPYQIQPQIAQPGHQCRKYQQPAQSGPDGASPIPQPQSDTPFPTR